MNCKHGQLVRYIGSNPFNRPNVYGWIGRTVRPDFETDASGNSELGWFVEPPMPGGVLWVKIDGIPYYSNGSRVLDRSLQPIDNPGDDAVDETIQRLGAPTRDEVAA